MAVQSLNVFEKHAGKLFLALTTLVSLVLAMLYVFGEPVKLEGTAGGEPKTPQQWQTELADKTKTLRGKIADTAEPIRPLTEVPDVRDFQPRVAPELTQMAFAPLVGPPRPVETAGPIAAQPSGTLDLARFTPLLKGPGQPIVDVGRGLALVPERDAQGKVRLDAQNKPVQTERQIAWAIVSAPIPTDSWRAFAEALRKDVEEQSKGDAGLAVGEIPLLLDVRLMRQELDAAGQEVAAKRVARFAMAAQSDYSAPPDEKDRNALANWIGHIAAFKAWLANNQLYVWRPSFYEMVGGRQPRITAMDRERELGELVQPPAGQAAGQPAGQPGELPAPDPSRRDVIWLYVVDDTIEPDKAYRWQVVVTLFNPLVNFDKLKGEQNRQVAIPLPLSDWTRVVHVERNLYCFLAGEAGGQVSMAVYRFAWGRWHRRSYDLAVGRPVGDAQVCEIAARPAQPGLNPVNLALGERYDEARRAIVTEKKVDFQTGLIPVDIRRDVELMVRRAGQGGRGASFGTSTTLQVVLADAAGRLVVRNMGEDLYDAKQAELIDQIRAQSAPAGPEPAGTPTGGRGPGAPAIGRPVGGGATPGGEKSLP